MERISEEASPQESRDAARPSLQAQGQRGPEARQSPPNDQTEAGSNRVIPSLGQQLTGFRPYLYRKYGPWWYYGFISCVIALPLIVVYYSFTLVYSLDYSSNDEGHNYIPFAAPYWIIFWVISFFVLFHPLTLCFLSAEWSNWRRMNGYIDGVRDEEADGNDAERQSSVGGNNSGGEDIELQSMPRRNSSGGGGNRIPDHVATK